MTSPTRSTKETAAARKAIERCKLLARFSETAGGILRTFLSAPMRDCHREFQSWLAPLGVEAKIDAAGNFRAVYPGARPNAPRILIGSHLDSVPNAGAYDGVLGVVLAAALIENLNGRQLPFAIEIVGFSDEEGVRFGVPFIGSRALAGTLDDELLRQKDTNGVSVREAIQNFGCDPAEIPAALVAPDALGYLEFHIEQGPVLDELSLSLAAVDAIAGQSRLEVAFRGAANHAGTTPMSSRRDSLAGAAEWIAAVEQHARAIDGLVATVGTIEASPGATNVIPGETRVSLDIRHARDETGLRSLEILLRSAEEISARRGLQVHWTERMNQPGIAMDKFLVSQIEAAIADAGCEPHRMASGAGHDAMILAQRIPAAMIFLRSPGGISHNPAETVEAEDVARAIECGAHLLDRLATSPQFLSNNLSKEMPRA